MAAAIPAALKSADIARFAQRAGQLENAKPVVAYWCNYWIVEQILSKGLHQKDDSCKNYTMNLMDKLEQTKADYEETDAISDDMAGQRYIEQFGLETFQRAENAMKANKASRQTADTFQAAATFLDLCQIWGPLEPEVASKSKFAKYHSLRILKAIKAGEDPNLSNPTIGQEEPRLDPNDPDVQILNNQHSSTRRQASVEEVPDEHDRIQRHLAQHSTHDESLHPSRAPSVPPQSDLYRPPLPQVEGDDYYRTAPPEISPLSRSTHSQPVPEASGYFPNIADAQPNPPDAAPQDPSAPSQMDLQDEHPLPGPYESSSSNIVPAQSSHTSSLHSFPPPSLGGSISSPPAPHVSSHAGLSQITSIPSFSTEAQATAATSSSEAPTRPSFHMTQTPLQPNRPSHLAAASLAVSQTHYLNDEKAVAEAQKHARWAISALNFEDVSTAVKELRAALDSLGAR